MLKQNLLELLKCGSYPESSSFSPTLSFLMWRANFITVWISTGTCLTGLLLSVVLTTCSPRSGTSWKTLPFFHVGLCFLMHVRWDPGPSTVASHGSVWCWWLPNVSLQLLHVLPACPQLPSAPLSFNSFPEVTLGEWSAWLSVWSQLPTTPVSPQHFLALFFSMTHRSV